MRQKNDNLVYHASIVFGGKGISKFMVNISVIWKIGKGNDTNVQRYGKKVGYQVQLLNKNSIIKR